MTKGDNKVTFYFLSIFCLMTVSPYHKKVDDMPVGQ